MTQRSLRAVHLIRQILWLDKSKLQQFNRFCLYNLMLIVAEEQGWKFFTPEALCAASQGVSLVGMTKLQLPGFPSRHLKCPTQLCSTLLVFDDVGVWKKSDHRCAVCEKIDIEWQDVIPQCQQRMDDLTSHEYNQEKLSDYIQLTGLYLPQVLQ